MKHSTDVKQTIIDKLLRPNGPTVRELSVEMGLREETLYRWRREARNGGMSESRKQQKSLNLRQKLAMVLEGRGMQGEALGHWLREKGVHESQLAQWTQEIDAALENTSGRGTREAGLEREKKALEKELDRKEKALAEITALAVLKKKLDRMFGDEGPQI